jgi:ribonuclease D
MNDTAQLQYIDTAGALLAFCNRIAGADWIALDTEFLREKTYYPKLCLLQIATPDVVACVDPLALDDLDPLLDLIFDPGITKVMHSARQDMEIFFHLRGAAPAPVFDTQIAALLLGYPDQIGYGNLVRELLGVSLEKLHTRADWSLRPLSDPQLQYAADDVIYLVEVYRQLQAKLQQLGRLEWLAEDFQQLSSADLYLTHPEQAWLKVKGSNRLKGASLAVLQSLAKWREERAIRSDRPRGWILRDDALIEIARHRPASVAALGKLRGLSERLVSKSGAELVAVVAQAGDSKPQPFPNAADRVRLTPVQDALVDAMLALVRLSGAQHALNPAVLASRKELEKLALGNADTDVMHGWRRKLVGEQLQALLDGELGLAVRDGQLVMTAAARA